MKKAIVTIHSASRRKSGYSQPLSTNLGAHGYDVGLYEANWADLGDPSTFGDAEKFASIRREFFREVGVPRLAMRFIEPRGGDPAASLGSAFDPILLYGFIVDVRRRVQQRLLSQLVAARDDGHASATIVAHSMGSVVAFDLLAAMTAADRQLPQIDMLVTLGSPLWMPFFDARHAKKLYAVGSWMNLYHPDDFIGRALLPAFGDDGPCPPLDMPLEDSADPQAPHSHYWASPMTSQALRHAWQGLATEH